MKLNFKSISLIIILGTLFYLLVQKHKKSLVAQIKNPQEQLTILDKKTNSANLPAPKVYTSSSAQNYLGIGKKINSKK